MRPREVLALIRRHEVTTVDLRFMDFPGVWQHFSIPAEALEEETFEEGIGFDGSTVMGWRRINEADLLILPQSETALIDPFAARPTLTMICNIQDPVTKQDYTRDPRNIARKAVNYMRSLGIADECRVMTELEFFVFDDVKFEQEAHRAFHFLDSSEGGWNRGRDERPNLAGKIPTRVGYFPCPPMDSLADLRTEMARILNECGIGTTAQFHQSTGGQGEIDLTFQPLVTAADQVMLARSIIRNVAHRANKSATFMPKPLFGENGSGLHTHFTLWREGEPILAGNRYAGLSEIGLYALGGLLKHAPALCAFANPTTNSYKRLIPGFEAPYKLAYSRRNREAILRVPIHGTAPAQRRIEYRCPDGAANPYLLFSAMLLAVMDGIQTKADPGDPYDRDLYDLEPTLQGDVPPTPRSLEASLKALEEDHEFLLRGDVFTPDVIETWIWYKREHEVEAVHVRPHPYEFSLYYDA